MPTITKPCDAQPIPAYFSAPDTARISGITYRQLDYWARIDLVRPSIAEARGSGSRRRYSLHDIRVLSVIRTGLELGVRLSALVRLVADLRDPAAWERMIFIALDGTIGDTPAVLDGSGAGMVLDLPNLAKRVEEDIARSRLRVA